MSNPYGNQPANPSMQSKKSGSSTVTIVLIVMSIFFGMFVCTGILAALLLPAIQQARAAARRMVDSNNIRQIGLALLNYEATFKQFPPAYTVDADGNKLHSWRVAILPFLERPDLYEQVDFSKPWDAPENAAVRNAVIGVYQSPNLEVRPGMTSFQAVIHPQGAFSGSKATRQSDITDGAGNTLLIMQAGRDHVVHWMEPSDVDLNYFQNMNPKANVYFGGTHVITCDGAARFLQDSASSQERKSLVTRDGND